MGNEITINTWTLSGDIETLQQQLNVIRTDMDKMYDAVRVLDSMWDGPANEAFNVQFNSDRNDMLELCNVVQKIIDCMEYAKKEYNSCEADVGSIVASIAI